MMSYLVTALHRTSRFGEGAPATEDTARVLEFGNHSNLFKGFHQSYLLFPQVTER